MNILIVDDSKAIRCMLLNVLKGAGHEVVEAANGPEGLAAAEQAKFDLVITDVNMPAMDGFEFTRQLRQSQNYKFAPVIFLTTETDNSFRMKGMEVRATAWLTKPFSPQKLIDVVAKVGTK